MAMRMARMLGAVVLLLTWAAIPALACLLPAQPLTVAEMDCCKHMVGQCESMGMGADHSCCQKTKQDQPSIAAISRQAHAPASTMNAMTVAQSQVPVSHFETRIQDSPS